VRVVGLLLLWLSVVRGSAMAEPRLERRNAIYVEALGKGGIWGLGYERRLGHKLGVGGVGSFTILDGDRLYSATPYVSVFPLRRGRHALFADAGIELVRIARPSPIPEWDDTHQNGIGAEMSAGYEYRGRLLLRLYGQAVGGKRGVAPWAGASIGWVL
jgi:hypothetical protein